MLQATGAGSHDPAPVRVKFRMSRMRARHALVSFCDTSGRCDVSHLGYPDVGGVMEISLYAYVALLVFYKTVENPASFREIY